MISVLVLGSSTVGRRSQASGAVVRSLAALVSGAVEGVIRDVQLIGSPEQPEFARVAEHAGCAYLAAELPQAIQQATVAERSPNILIIAAGISFDRALTDEMASTVSRHEGWLDQGIALKAVESGILGRLSLRFVPTVGVLSTRERLQGLAPSTASALWRSIKPRRSFKTRAWSGGA